MVAFVIEHNTIEKTISRSHTRTVLESWNRINLKSGLTLNLPIKNNVLLSGPPLPHCWKKWTIVRSRDPQTRSNGELGCCRSTKLLCRAFLTRLGGEGLMDDAECTLRLSMRAVKFWQNILQCSILLLILQMYLKVVDKVRAIERSRKKGSMTALVPNFLRSLVFIRR
jgi:hypothetical protein